MLQDNCRCLHLVVIKCLQGTYCWVFFCNQPFSLTSCNIYCSWHKGQLHWKSVNLTRFNTVLKQIIKQCGGAQMIMFEHSLKKIIFQSIFGVYPEKIIFIYWTKWYKKWSLVKYIYRSSHLKVVLRKGCSKKLGRIYRKHLGVLCTFHLCPFSRETKGVFITLSNI